MQPTDLRPKEIAQMRRDRLHTRLLIGGLTLLVLIFAYFIVDRIVNPKIQPEAVSTVNAADEPKQAFDLLFDYIADDHGWEADDRQQLLERNKVNFYRIKSEGLYLMIVADGSSGTTEGDALKKRFSDNLATFTVYSAYSWDPKSGTIYKCPEAYLRSLTDVDLQALSEVNK